MTNKDIEILERLFVTIKSRQGADPSSSYTAKLFAAGDRKICKKIEEEALEVIQAALKETDDRVVSESADLLYHLLVLWASKGIEPDQVWAELARRKGTSGIEEKNSRKKQ
jgi:phosphoribosyl-ATP pyrophosphohydrolase